jgi:hypothetical protein
MYLFGFFHSIILDLWKQGVKGRGDLFAEGRSPITFPRRQLGLKIHPRIAHQRTAAAATFFTCALLNFPKETLFNRA